MHEIGIAEEILAIAARYAGDKRVRRIVVEVGRLTAILPDAMQSCFELCTEGTAAEGATLEIIEVPVRGRCRACGAEATFDQPLGTCACGSTDLDWVAGDEIKVRTVEIEE